MKKLAISALLSLVICSAALSAESIKSPETLGLIPPVFLEYPAPHTNIIPLSPIDWNTWVDWYGLSNGYGPIDPSRIDISEILRIDESCVVHHEFVLIPVDDND